MQVSAWSATKQAAWKQARESLGDYWHKLTAHAMKVTNTLGGTGTVVTDSLPGL